MANKKFGYILNESAAAVSEVEILEKGPRVTAKAVLQTGNQQNRNGRIYRTEDLIREINAPRQRELISTKNMLGEAGHPMTTDLMRQQTIDPKCQCVRYLEFWAEGDNIMGKFKGTNNELGNAFDQDLREGVLPAFSYRALGSVEETAKGSIVTNLKMITYDYVIYPSHPTAYTVGLLSESAILKSSLFNSRIANLLPEHERMQRLDGTKSFVTTFTNEQVVEKLRKMNESGAVDYIKDKSHNFNLMKECFDITKAANIDLQADGTIIISESGIGTMIMDIDDYVMKEILTYTR